ncbi:uncharacterized protein LOC105664882 [Ceratitis capitata]|uniref:(Mediterranean fruit fly) hypothetical protein n=1 Tax=Ceratitis capitata TaxID=7213 RepID=A0A811V4T3_CERCA|nr:uncharacterized protein LOC105664882 [Ceratitis capitata]CAD7006642.1 unnamed protein product [Ceratitis capitata]
MRYKTVGCLQTLCLVLLVQAQEPQHEYEVKNMRRRGVVENLGEGLKFAGQMFGINTAADVANLVAMAFANKKPDFMSIFQQKQTNERDGESEATHTTGGNSQEQQQQQQQQQQQHQEEKGESEEQSNKRIKPFDFSTSRFVTGVLRMVGFDATKLGALAINALVMIAEVIGNAFTSPAREHTPSPTFFDYFADGVPDALRVGERETHQPRALREGTPIDWYLENPDEGMRRTLDDALDSELAERITQMIANVEQQSGGQGGCLKMLMCKSSPIIWGMQRSVSERVAGKATNATEPEAPSKEGMQPKKIFSSEVFFAHFPTLQEFRKHSTVCDERFRDECNLKEDMDKLMKDVKSSKRS